MRLEKITWVEMRRACMSSDEMSSDEMRKNQTLKRDVPGRRCEEIVAACCCKAQKACAHPIGTCFVPLYRLQMAIGVSFLKYPPPACPGTTVHYMMRLDDAIFQSWNCSAKRAGSGYVLFCAMLFCMNN